MKDIIATTKSPDGLTKNEVEEVLKEFISVYGMPEKTLLLPPDHTRLYSGGGMIANMLYHMMDKSNVDVMPALGTHEALNKEQCDGFFGDIPFEKIKVHDWRNDVVSLGEVPAEFVSKVSNVLMNESFKVQVNKALVSEGYGLLVSIGQVVPHEVVGMANYSKNTLVGCGGSDMINKSHMLGAIHGLERIMGRDKTPVREVFDYAQDKFLSKLPLVYIMTVATNIGDKTCIHGIFIGTGRSAFEEAAKLAQTTNMTILDKPIQKAVVYLEPEEFRSTWIGNKSIYRTRMAIADGGELIILAPGLSHFGEDPQIDALIRKYGYMGRDNVLKALPENEDLQNNRSGTAHLIHGSTEGRFKVTYAPGHLTREEIESVGYSYMTYSEAAKLYDHTKLEDGYNTMPDGSEIFFISNPSIGLWADREIFNRA